MSLGRRTTKLSLSSSIKLKNDTVSQKLPKRSSLDSPAAQVPDRKSKSVFRLRKISPPKSQQTSAKTLLTLFRPSSPKSQPTIPLLKLPTTSIPTLRDLENQIASMKDPAEKQLVVHLNKLRDYLKDRLTDQNSQLFLSETITMLKKIDTIKTNFQYESGALVAAKANPEEYVKLVEYTLVEQSSAVLNFERNCKPASCISGYNGKIIACIAITAFFAILGCIAGSAFGFVLGGGIFSQFTTLAGMAQGALTGVTIGAAFGALVTGIPAFAISQHFLFKPTKLKKLQDAIVTETQNIFASEERERNNFLNM